jgi:hypothetical protein
MLTRQTSTRDERRFHGKARLGRVDADLSVFPDLVTKGHVTALRDRLDRHSTPNRIMESDKGSGPLGGAQQQTGIFLAEQDRPGECSLRHTGRFAEAPSPARQLNSKCRDCAGGAFSF